MLKRFSILNFKTLINWKYIDQKFINALYKSHANVITLSKGNLKIIWLHILGKW